MIACSSELVPLIEGFGEFFDNRDKTNGAKLQINQLILSIFQKKYSYVFFCMKNNLF